MSKQTTPIEGIGFTPDEIKHYFSKLKSQNRLFVEMKKVISKQILSNNNNQDILKKFKLIEIANMLNLKCHATILNYTGKGGFEDKTYYFVKERLQDWIVEGLYPFCYHKSGINNYVIIPLEQTESLVLKRCSLSKERFLFFKQKYEVVCFND